ncbi:putative poly(U)-specific endoribonuclease-C-like isoform 4 [Scophthalmus maximus]|uniref:Uridylate-specific endoribonuclease n=1 Tax=Scophthalmus maximus TaxID=52904 RepID=A0A2U9BWG4_SCOMX|nr:uridylate-specific endoribonuclease C isoform X1 [Scophthalmus maximus]AWP08645.1 putative poly(U)-specific endoribonuclease-C-like isoform 4 [Scophthalmus maximus]
MSSMFCRVLSLLVVFLGGLKASRPAVNQELSTLFNELWRLDVNRLSPGLDYTISVQGRASFVSQGSHVVRDHASQPLFSNVNEIKLKNMTTTSWFMKLLDNYEHSTGVTERVTTEEQNEINLFLDAVLQTEVMKRAHTYLVSKGKSNSDLRMFKRQLNLIWFNLYRRQRNTGLDSSGFEHVFVGETKSGAEIIGFHNWIQFYLQEKNSHLDYKGYKARDHDLPDQDDHVLNLQFSWHGLVKPVGSAFIGTSPEFEMALFTVVFLMNTERSTTVLVNIDQCQMELVVIRHGRSLGTAYPKLLSSNSRHVRQHSH